jgi:hypothetical protein
VEVSGGGDILTLGGNNSYGGATTADPNCAIYIQNNNALGDPATGTTVQAGGRLGFSAPVGNWTVAEPLTLNGTGFAGAPGALWMDTDNNNATLTGPVTLASPTQIRLTALNTLTFSNTVTAANQPLQCTGTPSRWAVGPLSQRTEPDRPFCTGALTCGLVPW